VTQDLATKVLSPTNAFTSIKDIMHFPALELKCIYVQSNFSSASKPDALPNSTKE